MAEEPTVATPSSAHMQMTPKWELIDDLLGGTQAMRAAGTRHLPMHQEERAQAYQERLMSTPLLNMTKMVLGSLTGRVFRDDPKLENVPADVELLLEDVDLAGSQVWAFCREWFKEGLAKGMSHVLVEFQRPPRPDDPVQAAAQAALATLDDDRKAGLRPYWTRISPENMIAAYGQMVDGQMVPTHIRFREDQVERSGWSERLVQRIRVVEPDQWELWELRQVVRSQKPRWVSVDSGPNSLGFIPLVTFYTNQEGFMLASPPLEDLANLNVTHWQSSSDQRNILTVSRFPILAVSGATPEDAATLTIGPNKWLSTTAPDAKWYYVEHTGAAINAGAADLASLEKQMADYGAEFMKEAPDNQAGVARLLDSSESTSALAAFARDFGMCVEQALELTGKWLKLTGDMGTVIMTVDLGGEAADKASLDSLVQARAMRDISRPGFLTELKRKDVLSEDFDVEGDAALLKDEMAEEMVLLGPGPVDPNAPGPARVLPKPPSPEAPSPARLPPGPAGPGISHDA